MHDKLKAESWRVLKLNETPTKTFNEACLRWLHEKDHKKSIDDDKTKIEFFLKYFHNVPLKEITEDRIRLATESMDNRKHRQNWELKRDSCLKQGKAVPEYIPKLVSQGTKSQHLSFMRSLLRAAYQWRWLDSVPIVKVNKPRNKRIRWITKLEANNLITAAADHLKPVIIFALSTGLRRSNIINLEWSQIDMQRKVAWIHPDEAKGGKAIGIALNDTACKVLRDQIGLHNRYVFVHTDVAYHQDGTKTKKIRKMRIDGNSAWKGALKRAGIEDFRFHDLRHTWASWLVQSGTPLHILQEMGGWESIEMVQCYAHLAPNHLKEHAKRLDGFINEKDQAVLLQQVG